MRLDEMSDMNVPTSLSLGLLCDRCQVSVEILDVNDNSPRFRDSEIQLAVIEAAQVGSAYILPTASDDDSPDNGVQRYELDSPQTGDKFSLDVGTKLDGAAEVSHHILIAVTNVCAKRVF